MTTQNEPNEIAELRKELRQKQDWVKDNEELWLNISRWLIASQDNPAGSARDLVDQRVASLTSDPKHKMYPHRDVDDDEAAFPSDCESCPHYGVQCPVVSGYHSRREYERIFEQADDFVGEMRRYAQTHHCHVIQDALEEYDETYRSFVAAGDTLRTRLVAETSNIDVAAAAEKLGIDPDDIFDQSVDALDEDGPPADIAANVEQVTADLMRDEDEDVITGEA